ncbi:EVE domain-containing protein [Amphibiibacter pelophylacis]|uniref:EVE domain-containing protein n=1 Tax=Amphibiibacter pelophylacis TaxID=1799477 RepID=A0ACC6NZ97_9BURK
MKSEPDEVGIQHLEAQPQAAFPWFGVRNYQARNFIRDAMREGDLALFWHSSCPQPGIAGLCEIISPAVPDPTQFDPASPYFDAASRPDAPRWLQRDVRFVARTRLVAPAELRAHPALQGLRVLARGNRLSVMPVESAHWAVITQEILALA